MGYMRHHMIVVTSWDKKLIWEAHMKACEIFFQPSHVGNSVGVTPIMTSPVNHYYTFFVPPDGSKEGWNDSDDGDENRVVTEGFRELIDVDQPGLVASGGGYREQGDLVPSLFELAQGVEHGGVLGGDADNVLALTAISGGGAQDRQIVTFRCPAREDDIPGRAIKEVRDTTSRLLYQLRSGLP